MPDELKSICKIFADDNKIYKSIGEVADQNEIQDDLIEICDWSDIWLLRIFVPKCKAIQYGYVRFEKKKQQQTYQMRDQDNVTFDIPSAEDEKGILFDKTLKFNKHVLNVVNRCKRLTGLINIATVSKAHIPPAVAIRGHTTLRQKADYRKRYTSSHQMNTQVY